MSDIHQFKSYCSTLFSQLSRGTFDHQLNIIMKTRKQSKKTWGVLKLTAFTLLFITQTTSAQTPYSLNGDKATSVQVLGTSNVHDWTMVAKEIESNG